MHCPFVLLIVVRVHGVGAWCRYVEADSVWELLKRKSYGGQMDDPVVLLSAAWLRTTRPKTLPPRQQLPAEAIIPTHSLKAIHATIEKGMAKACATAPPPHTTTAALQCDRSAAAAAPVTVDGIGV